MEFVTDRQLSDVGVNPKGSYNISDFSRVNTNVKNIVESVENVETEIQNKMTEKGVAWDDVYKFPYNAEISVVEMPEYTYNSIPTTQEWTDYVGNVQVLADNFSVEHNLPTTLNNLNVDGANAIEKALENVYNVFNEAKDNVFSKIERTVWEYTGDYYGGDM